MILLRPKSHSSLCLEDGLPVSTHLTWRLPSDCPACCTRRGLDGSLCGPQCLELLQGSCCLVYLSLKPSRASGCPHVCETHWPLKQNERLMCCLGGAPPRPPRYWKSDWGHKKAELARETRGSHRAQMYGSYLSTFLKLSPRPMCSPFHLFIWSCMLLNKDLWHSCGL